MTIIHTMRRNKIKDLAKDDQPRQKMLINGATTLSNAELLCILINNGNSKFSALQIAQQLLENSQNNLNQLGKLNLAELQKTTGIGKAKAITIKAALELGTRRQAEDMLSKIVIGNSNELANYLKTVLKDYKHEVFAVVFLNRANKINTFEIISHGGITGTVADPRMIFKRALEQEAVSIVLTHNHPSGSLQPSIADIELTKKLKQAGQLLDIQVLDHIIVSEEGYYSFADNGKI